MSGRALAGAALAAAAWALAAPAGGPRTARAVAPSAVLARTPAALGLAHETVTFPAAGDSAKLEGWWIPGRPHAPVLVMAGPAEGNRADLLKVAQALHGRGLALLLFDYRDFGPAGPGAVDTLRHLAMASRWVDDALGALRFARARAGSGVPVFGWGHGLGGPVLLAAAGRGRGAVDGLVLDNPFRSTSDQMRWEGTSVIADAEKRQRLRILPQDEPFAAVARLRVPVFLTLAAAEPSAPPEVADQLFLRARVRVDRWLVPGATRATLLETPGYAERVGAWLDLASHWAPSH